MFGLVKRSLLDTEIARVDHLTKEIEKKSFLINDMKERLSALENEYSNLINSEQYKRSIDFDSLLIQLDDVRYEIESEKELLRKFKESELSKANNEIASHFEKLFKNNEASADREKSKHIATINLLKTNAEKLNCLLRLMCVLHSVAIRKSVEEINYFLADKLGNEERKLSKVKSEVIEERSKLSKLKKELTVILSDISAKNAELNEIKNHIEISDEIETVNAVMQDFVGLNSSEIQIKIDGNKEKQKEIIALGKAWTADNHYSWNGSLSAGKAQQRRLGKFLLAAFNAQVDNIISSARKGNFHNCHIKIEKWFDKINKIGEDHFIVLEREYLKLRLEELKIVVEYHIKKEFEKEEERYTNESIREEKRVQKEIESFVKLREKEEKNYRDEIERITREIKESASTEVDNLKNVINDLKLKLERSLSEKERAMSLAQLTRSGHVYIISNEGSFGKDVFKIGMTRRLDPLDRVKELGDASVPFFFDVHGIIHSDNAPGLERELHKRFENRRVNKENFRREFFRVSIEEIEEAVCEIHGKISLDYKSHNQETEKGSFQDED